MPALPDSEDPAEDTAIAVFAVCNALPPCADTFLPLAPSAGIQPMPDPPPGTPNVAPDVVPPVPIPDWMEAISSLPAGTAQCSDNVRKRGEALSLIHI